MLSFSNESTSSTPSWSAASLGSDEAFCSALATARVVGDGWREVERGSGCRSGCLDMAGAVAGQSNRACTSTSVVLYPRSSPIVRTIRLHQIRPVYFNLLVLGVNQRSARYQPEETTARLPWIADSVYCSRAFDRVPPGSSLWLSYRVAGCHVRGLNIHALQHMHEARRRAFVNMLLRGTASELELRAFDAPVIQRNLSSHAARVRGSIEHLS